MRHLIILLSLFLTTNHAVSQHIFASSIPELIEAFTIAVPGDTITLAEGTYTDTNVFFFGDGEEGNPIVFQAETPGRVVFTGSTRFRIGGDYLVVSGLVFRNCIATATNLIEFRGSRDANNSRLTETVIVDCNPPDQSTDYKWVGIFGQNNEVDHCYIADKTHIGATLVVWSGDFEGKHHVHHNYFGPRPRPAGDPNGYETIRIGTSSYAQMKGSNLVEHNYFYATDGEIEIISGKSSYSTYRYNIFRNCRGGLTLRHGTNCRVEGNIFFGEGKAGSYGIRIMDRDHLVINNYFYDLNDGGSSIRNPISLMSADADPIPSGVQHTIRDTIAYNTVVNCQTGIVIAPGGDPFVPDSALVVNNLVSISNDAPLKHSQEPTSISYEGNLFHRIGGSVTFPDSGFVEVDPELVLTEGDSIYRISENSPAIGASVTGIVDPVYDFELHPRPDIPSIGADELSALPAVDRGIYGPTWDRSGIISSVDAPTLVQGGIQLLTQSDGQHIGLRYPRDGDYNGGIAHIQVYDWTGSRVQDNIQLQQGETINLGQEWTANQYIISIRFDEGTEQNLRWIKW